MLAVCKSGFLFMPPDGPVKRYAAGQFITSAAAAAAGREAGCVADVAVICVAKFIMARKGGAAIVVKEREEITDIEVANYAVSHQLAEVRGWPDRAAGTPADPAAPVAEDEPAVSGGEDGEDGEGGDDDAGR